jgi:uncharacterized protein (DUF952 family)
MVTRKWVDDHLATARPALLAQFTPGRDREKGRKKAKQRFMATIFHITTEREWQEAVQRGRYGAPSLSTAGFIHCSGRHQVIRVANSIFRGVDGLVLLYVDMERLSSPVVYENLEGGAEVFPHVYGPIDLDAVRNVTPFEPAEDGSFDHHFGDMEPS